MQTGTDEALAAGSRAEELGMLRPGKCLPEPQKYVKIMAFMAVIMGLGSVYLDPKSM